MQKTKDRNIIEIGIWCLSNLCRGSDPPPFKVVYKAIPIFVNAIKTEAKIDILIDASWALSYLSDGNDEQIKFVISTNIIPVLK